MNLPSKPSRIDFEKVDVYEIQRVLSTGSIESLSPAERKYYDLMELVRGLRARVSLPGQDKIVTKASIIKLLKSDVYGLTDFMARQVYADAINFFYTDDSVRPKAWAALYAEKAEKMADAAIAVGDFKSAKSFLSEAAKLRGCFEAQEAEIPQELLDMRRTIIYTSDAEQLGAPRADRKELEAYIDSLPELAETTRRRVKEDAGVSKRNLLSRLIGDIREFGDEEAGSE